LSSDAKISSIRIKLSPLYRALRLGKLDLFLLESTLESHLTGKETLTDQLLRLDLPAMEKRAQKFCQKLSKFDAKVVKGDASMAAGQPLKKSLNPSRRNPVQDAQKARSYSPAKVRRFLCAKVRKPLSIDLRTVFPHEEDPLASGLACLS